MRDDSGHSHAAGIPKHRAAGNESCESTVASSYDALVVGAGPAGSSAAYNLTRQGARVLVVDATDVMTGRYKTCGSGYTEKLWWSFPETVYESTMQASVTTLRVRSKRHHSADHLSTAPIAHMSMRSILDSELLESAVDTGSEFRISKVEGITFNGRPSVRLKGGESVTADYLIAADGAYSMVTRTLGIPRHRRQVVAVEDEAFGRTHVDWSRTIEILLSVSPIGYWWVFPKSDHLSTGFGAPARAAKKIKHWAIDYANTHVRDARHNLSGHYIPLRDPGYPVYRNRTFIVGDAGGFVDPCTGEGISWGALSGKYAAQAIIATDPGLYLNRVAWIDREFYAARAFRNLLITRLTLRPKQLLEDSRFWQTFIRIARGEYLYQQWYAKLPRPLKLIAWSINRVAPI